MSEVNSNISHPLVPKDPEIPPPEDPSAPSTDLSWHPRIQRWWWRIRGKYRTYRDALFPKPTHDQLEAAAWERLEKQRSRIAHAEGKLYATRAARILGKVRWTMVSWDEDFTKIILALDTNPEKLPRNLLVSKLTRDPFYNDDLAAAIGRPVTWSVGDFGAILIIQRPVAEKPARRVITVEDLLEE